MAPAVTAERFAEGMTFDEYLRYIATPENLARIGNWPATTPPRTDQSVALREAFEARRLTEDQVAALRWLVDQPRGPANLLVIAEEWSSDCQRDLPTFARLAEDTGIELRIFTRDGLNYSTGPVSDPDESPNADLMAQFLKERGGTTFQSIPVAAFFTRDMEYLYHYQEFPAVYDKDGLRANPGAPLNGDTEGWAALRAGPFFRVWASSAVDEIISQLHHIALTGTPLPRADV
ncbi:MAG: thioredoxin family protein [Dehalococcoidia bacterium]